MSWAPHVTVATVVYRQQEGDRDGKYLLVYEESEGQMVYNQPAGHLEADETLEQAALRETLEETGWHINLTGVLGITLYTSPRNGVTYHRTTFVAEPLTEVPNPTLDEGIEAAIWLSYEEILERRDQLRSEVVLEVIEDHRRDTCYPLEMIRTRGDSEAVPTVALPA